MKRLFFIIIPILLVVSFIVYAVNSHRAYKTQIEAKKTQKERIRKNVTSVVANLTKKHNAFDWVKEIEGRKEFLDLTPVLTVELEKLWLTDRPTLFIGTIKDISTLDQKYYLIKIQGIAPIMVSFGLELKCPMQKVNSLLKEHPDVTRGITSGVAVIAKIDNIKTVTVHGHEGKEDIRIGEGKSLDIVYLDDILISLK